MSTDTRSWTVLRWGARAFPFACSSRDTTSLPPWGISTRNFPSGEYISSRPRRKGHFLTRWWPGTTWTWCLWTRRRGDTSNSRRSLCGARGSGSGSCPWVSFRSLVPSHHCSLFCLQATPCTSSSTPWPGTQQGISQLRGLVGHWLVILMTLNDA